MPTNGISCKVIPMTRWLRRFFWLGVVMGAGYGAYRAWAARQAQSAATPAWSSSATPASSTPASAPPAPAETADPARWVAADVGECPIGYPIKVNESSGIYHVPGGRFYARTAAERCYATADDAIADGYRPSKA
jgi:hypothetical protein